VIASGFSWSRLIPAIDKDTWLHRFGLDEHSLNGWFATPHSVPESHVYVHAWLAAGALIVFALVARVALDRARARQGIEKYFTSERPTVLAIAEVFASGIRSLMGDLLGPRDVRAFFPVVAGLFAYILACNLQSLLPGFLPPTDNVNTNTGMALMVFVLFNAIGLLRDPVGYVKHLAGPALLVMPLLFPIELISLAIRPVSLTIRLTANLFGDHAVFTIMSGLFPPIGAALLVLALIVSVIQAFVFSLLTVIYINLSLPHDDHDHAATHEEGHAH
jgi:F-type H+-transporting ATPase subunit a